DCTRQVRKQQLHSRLELQLKQQQQRPDQTAGHQRTAPGERTRPLQVAARPEQCDRAVAAVRVAIRQERLVVVELDALEHLRPHHAVELALILDLEAVDEQARPAASPWHEIEEERRCRMRTRALDLVAKEDASDPGSASM